MTCISRSDCVCDRKQQPHNSLATDGHKCEGALLHPIKTIKTHSSDITGFKSLYLCLVQEWNKSECQERKVIIH